MEFKVRVRVRGSVRNAVGGTSILNRGQFSNETLVNQSPVGQSVSTGGLCKITVNQSKSSWEYSLAFNDVTSWSTLWGDYDDKDRNVRWHLPTLSHVRLTSTSDWRRHVGNESSSSSKLSETSTSVSVSASWSCRHLHWHSVTSSASSGCRQWLDVTSCWQCRSVTGSTADTCWSSSSTHIDIVK